MASKESQIAGAITALAVVVFAAFIVKPAFDEWRASRAIAKFQEELGTMADKASLEVRRAQQQELERRNRRSQMAAAEQDAKRLKAGEQCISGFVVLVTRREGVPSYEQVLAGGSPVKCAGNRRL